MTIVDEAPPPTTQITQMTPTAPTRPEQPKQPVLAEVIANRRWVRGTRPFPHVTASDVFTSDYYDVLDREFRRIQRERPEAFLRNMKGYDASGAVIDQFRDGPLGVFVSREWHDLLARLGGVPNATGDMSASLHHHQPGSESGWPHNDLNPGWFANPQAAADQVRCPLDGPPEQRVAYHRGDRAAGVGARENVRAVAALFYLANPRWNPGDGGETGLFAHSGARQPVVAVPPVNNSLVLFECTPYSWHGFLSNRSAPRNSIVMWVHRPKSDVASTWGTHAIVGW